MDVGNMFHEVADLIPVFIGQRISGGVGDIDHRGSGCNHCFDHPGQVLVVGPAGVLGVKFNILHERFCVFYRFHTPLNDLLRIAVQLVVNVVIGCSDPRMDPRPFGVLQRIRGHLDILLHCPGEPADDRLRDCFTDLHHGIEIAGA